MNIPTNDRFCDEDNCSLSNTIDSSDTVILICDHSYHKECLILLNDKCKHCFNYLSKNIKTNITSLDRRLHKKLNDNEIPELTKDENDGSNENHDDENIETLLEQAEHNIDIQYENLYNTWLNYNNI